MVLCCDRCADLFLDPGGERRDDTGDLLQGPPVREAGIGDVGQRRRDREALFVLAVAPSLVALAYARKFFV